MVQSDHGIWILASDWQRGISQVIELKVLLIYTHLRVTWEEDEKVNLFVLLRV